MVETQLSFPVFYVRGSFFPAPLKFDVRFFLVSPSSYLTETGVDPIIVFFFSPQNRYYQGIEFFFSLEPLYGVLTLFVETSSFSCD